MKKVLVVATHPDDEVLGCGGVMARHTANGDEVQVLVVSRGIPEIFPPELIESTRVELQKAHEILGVSGVTFLEFPAPRLDVIPGHELADAIGKVVHTFQPEIVYIPHRGDLHADHRAVYYASLVVCRPINGCPVRKLLCYETLSETDWAPPFGDEAFIPNLFIDITEYLDKKLAAMACYQTQLTPPPSSRSLEALEHLAKLRGSTVSKAAVEAFMLVREIV